MHFILSSILMLIIQHFSGMSPDDIERVKNFIQSLEDKAIDSVIKHQQAAELVKTLTKEATGTVIDWVIKTLLLWVRAEKAR